MGIMKMSANLMLIRELGELIGAISDIMLVGMKKPQEFIGILATVEISLQNLKNELKIEEKVKERVKKILS